MDAIRLAQLAEVVGSAPLAEAGCDRVAEAVTIHSERIPRAGVFFALPGSRTDGHRFVGEAFANGAVAAVVAAGRGGGGAGTVIEVDDPLRALQALAAWWRSQLPADVVAVVGSNGKTVTKDAIVHFAGYGRRVYGSPGSYNSQVGVPLAVLGIPRDCDVAVIEAAVSDPGEMARLESVVRPDQVVVTNLGTRWSSRFADRCEQAAELLVMAREASWVLVGEDAPELGAAHLVTGASPDLPRFDPPVRLPEGLGAAVAFPDGATGSILVRTPSDAVAQDVRTAISAAWLLGVGGATLLEAAGAYRPTATRLEIWRSPAGVTVVRDVATPDPIAAGAAVRAASRLAGPGQRCLVVLAEPLDDPSPAFASALVAEGASAVLGLDEASHRRVAGALAGRAEVHLVADTDHLRRLLLDEARPGDVVLVQSAPERGLGDLTVALMESMAPTRMYLDLAAVEDNVAAFRRLVGPSVRIMGMVKALAYGTDSSSVASCLQGAGVDALGVSGVDEGVALRRAGINVPTLVLLGTAAELPKMLRYRLTPLVYGPEMLEAVLSAGDFPVHVEVDSGMHRTGLPPDAAVAAVRRLGQRVAGLMTHLASPDDPAEDAATAEQLRRFREVDAAVTRLGVHGVVRHAAATAAAIRLPEARFDMVRIGLGLYGVHPSPATAALIELQCAVGLVSRIIEVVDVPPGERVGYGGTFTAPVPGRRVGIVPAGYHDGVPRAASNAGVAVVAGARCPIVGRVSMDSMAVDLTASPEAGVGTDVLVYGRQHDWSLPVEELAQSSGTIAHELMARLGPRVQRIFTRH